MKKLSILAFFVLAFLTHDAQSLRDTVRLEAFMNGLVNTTLRDKHIAGATVSIVQDGKVLLAKGYGFSDVNKQIPVNPDATLFRIGSVSKMFTWISVMQLVSQGKLKLDEDVNVYLKDFQIPATYPTPITLKDIMTHTPGFEDLVIGLFGRDSTSLKPFREIFAKEMPARVRASGTYASYSNHATGMAAYIVEQVSGMSFNEYVEKNILEPLNMTHTSFRQPLPANLAPMMSQGFKYAGGEYIKQSFEYVPLYPAGSCASSAVDMTKFMEAILYNGTWKGATILDSTTLALMETPAHRQHPHVNPMRHGFMDLSQNGVNVIGHGGDTFWFHSLMVVLPESHTGLFISFNTDKGGGVVLDFLDEFLKEYFPEKTPLASPMKVDRKFLERFAGAYRGNRYPYHDITTISSLFGDAKITVVDSTKIRVAAGESVKFYVPLDSLTFREEHSSKVIAFENDAKGNVAHMFIGILPIFAFDKVSGVKSAGFQLMIFIIVVIFTLKVLTYWPIVSWMRRGYQSKRDTLPLPMGPRILAWFNSLVMGSFYFGILIVLSDPNSIVYGVPTSLKVLLVLPLLSIALTLLIIVNAFRMAGDNRYTFSGRLYYVLIAGVAVVALWQLYYWNFIGFNY